VYRQIQILLIILALFCLPVRANDNKPSEFLINDSIDADAVMHEVIKRAELYGGYIKGYDAQIYVKRVSQVLKKNILALFDPDFFFINQKNDNAILEAIAKVHYQSPNLFSHEIKAISGNIRNFKDVEARAMRFLNFNIYNPTSFNDEVLMPVSKSAFNYYRFSYLSEKDTLGTKVLTIKIEPLINSQRLIRGTISVIPELWIITNADISGRWEFCDFRVSSDFGISNDEFLLPTQTNLFFKIDLLGNHVENYYVSKTEYINVEKYEDKSKRDRLSYDLTDYFNVKLDTLPIVKDSVFWSKNRPVALTPSEKLIYEKTKNKQIDTLDLNKNKPWNLTKSIVSSKEFDFMHSDFRYSGLINPFQLAYSKLDGFVYWQQLKLNHNFESDQAIAFEPEIGFVFKRKEVFFKVPVSWLYQPKRMGEISLSLGNSNDSYNSKVIDKINDALRDSTFNFDDLNLEYYKHYYLSLKNSYELFNGFISNVGIDYHLYRPVKNAPKRRLTEILSALTDEDYVSFAPVIGFTYTPHQYYRFVGKRKQYVGSRFPTFSVEYARGIPNIINSNSNYERIEADVQQRIPLDLLRSVRYYVGGGIFTNAKSVYFADFTKFSKRNFPRSWDDQMGGIFHLLDSKWYNASNSYAQAHFMFESPFILSHLFKNVSKDILRERIYIGQLYLPALPCYTEAGYAIGNYIFSAGVFSGFERGRYSSLGVKFNFEIGR
jgi:hypothetical protein